MEDAINDFDWEAKIEDMVSDFDYVDGIEAREN
jgi:hypothetical protein